MKFLKSLVLSIVLLTSVVGYIGMSVVEGVANGLIEKSEGAHYIEGMKKNYLLEPIYALVPVEYQQEVEEIVEKIENDSSIKQLYEKQINNVLGDIINGTNSLDQEALTSEMFGVLEGYSDEITSVTEGKVTTQKLQKEFEKRIVDYDIKTYYEKVITKVQNKLSPQQMSLMKSLNLVLSYQGVIKVASVLAFLVATVLMLLVSPRVLTYLSSFIIVLVVVAWSVSDKVMALVSSRLGLNADFFSFDQAPYKIVLMVVMMQLIASIVVRRYNRSN
jgi:hypothetical protein